MMPDAEVHAYAAKSRAARVAKHEHLKSMVHAELVREFPALDLARVEWSTDYGRERARIKFAQDHVAVLAFHDYEEITALMTSFADVELGFHRDGAAFPARARNYSGRTIPWTLAQLPEFLAELRSYFVERSAELGHQRAEIDSLLGALKRGDE